MALFNSSTESEIPGLSADAYAASFDHVASLEKFGRKWYASGVEAGLAQAGQDSEARAKLDQDLVTRNEELEENVKRLNVQVNYLIAINRELKEKEDKDLDEKDKKIESLTATAIATRDLLTAATDIILEVIEGPKRLPRWRIRQEIKSVVDNISYCRDVCTTSIDRARR